MPLPMITTADAGQRAPMTPAATRIRSDHSRKDLIRPSLTYPWTHTLYADADATRTRPPHARSIHANKYRLTTAVATTITPRGNTVPPAPPRRPSANPKGRGRPVTGSKTVEGRRTVRRTIASTKKSELYTVRAGGGDISQQVYRIAHKFSTPIRPTAASDHPATDGDRATTLR